MTDERAAIFEWYCSGCSAWTFDDDAVTVMTWAAPLTYHSRCLPVPTATEEDKT